MQRSFDPPIIDRSGLTGKFDITFTLGTSESATKQNLTEQLGLSLTPGIEPLDLLIVEADKGN